MKPAVAYRPPNPSDMIRAGMANDPTLMAPGQQPPAAEVNKPPVKKVNNREVSVQTHDGGKFGKTLYVVTWTGEDGRVKKQFREDPEEADNLRLWIGQGGDPGHRPSNTDVGKPAPVQAPPPAAVAPGGPDDMKNSPAGSFSMADIQDIMKRYMSDPANQPQAPPAGGAATKPAIGGTGLPPNTPVNTGSQFPVKDASFTNVANDLATQPKYDPNLTQTYKNEVAGIAPIGQGQATGSLVGQAPGAGAAPGAGGTVVTPFGGGGGGGGLNLTGPPKMGGGGSDGGPGPEAFPPDGGGTNPGPPIGGATPPLFDTGPNSGLPPMAGNDPETPWVGDTTGQHPVFGGDPGVDPGRVGGTQPGDGPGSAGEGFLDPNNGFQTTPYTWSRAPGGGGNAGVGQGPQWGGQMNPIGSGWDPTQGYNAEYGLDEYDPYRYGMRSSKPAIGGPQQQGGQEGGQQQGGQQGGPPQLSQTGGPGPTQNTSGMPRSQQTDAAISRMLQEMTGENDPEKLNALTQSILGLNNIPMQDYFNTAYPAAMGGAQGLFNQAQGRMGESYTAPNSPQQQDYGAGTVYNEGKPASQQMNSLIGAAQALGIPTEQMSTLAQTAANNLTSDFSGLEGSMAAQTQMNQKEEMNALEDSLAARGISNSSIGDAERQKMKQRHELTQQLARLQGEQVIGGEKRANTASIQSLLESLFGQQATGTQLGMGQIGQIGGLVGQTEGMDLARRQTEFTRQGAQGAAGQTNYENQWQNIMNNENIANSRLGAAQNPLAMIMSALSGVNVAPGTLGPLQMPRQGPGAGEMFGNILGNIVSGGASALTGKYLTPKKPAG